MNEFATEVLNWNWKFEVSLELLIPAANPCALYVTVSMVLCVNCIRRNKIVMMIVPSLSYTFKHLCVFRLDTHGYIIDYCN